LSISRSSSENAIAFCLSTITCLKSFIYSSESQPGGPKLTAPSLFLVILEVSWNSGGNGVRGVL
jgi:hypothetical protein